MEKCDFDDARCRGTLECCRGNECLGLTFTLSGSTNIIETSATLQRKSPSRSYLRPALMS